jgi:putative addiction module killer protein
MFTIHTTEQFDAWLKGLRDVQGKARILARIVRMQQGNFGDVKPVGNGVTEMRFFFGPGYRVYFTQRGEQVVLLLCGGDKDTQEDDIRSAISMVKEL